MERTEEQVRGEEARDLLWLQWKRYKGEYNWLCKEAAAADGEAAAAAAITLVIVDHLYYHDKAPIITY